MTLVSPCCSVKPASQSYLLQVHTLHRSIHALDDVRHAARHRPHRNSRLHARADGI
jgi:hypothetical protein